MSKAKSQHEVGEELKKGNKPLSLILLCVFLLFVDGFLIFFNYKKVDAESALKRMYVEDASELRVLSQSIAASAVAAANGSKDAFDDLDQNHKEFLKHWKNITEGNEKRGMDPGSHYSNETMSIQEDIKKIWTDKVEKKVESILDKKELTEEFSGTIYELSKTITSIQQEYDFLVESLLRANVPSDQIINAQRQSLLSERLKARMQRVSSGVEDVKAESELFARDINTFAQMLVGMRDGDAQLEISKVTERQSRDIIGRIIQRYSGARESLKTFIDNASQLSEVRSSAKVVADNSEALLSDLSKLSNAFREMPPATLFSNQLGILLGIIGVLIIIFIIILVWKSSRADSDRQSELLQQREQMLAAQNEESQAAILRLLDEISTLGDGDLTVTATVSEDFTGAIADAINYAIEQLRTLVATINETAVQVAASAQETQATAMHLAEASEHQAQEIAGASAAVNEMAVSIDQVSSNAGESTSVAEKAVDIAKKGSQVVHNTIEGMETIREQIQETSKRIKRLGESSQEIGDIISLITDIADQTNILALNAAIQASMAGDAGRGFAVVADEVQRLAERTSNATKQIEALVKTIQSDTNEAVISMENTTSEVVRGARLAQDAGVALEEIEQVSKALADLIFNISNAARQQAASAGHISNTMNVIQEITSQTSSGTTATARSIGNLAELADQMRKSVAGFKLPR